MTRLPHKQTNLILVGEIIVYYVYCIYIAACMYMHNMCMQQDICVMLPQLNKGNIYLQGNFLENCNKNRP